MFSGTKLEPVYLRELNPRRGLLWYAVVLTLAGFIFITILWLLVSVWKRQADTSDFETAAQVVASYPMQLRPLIAGKNRGTAGEMVYLSRVLLEPGPGPKVFFLAGSQGTQILTAADAAHVVATPGDIVDVRGIIRSTPPTNVLRTQWKLSPADAKRISKMPIYIESDFIRESVRANVSREEYP
jgi:hypothetical protein